MFIVPVPAQVLPGVRQPHTGKFVFVQPGQPGRLASCLSTAPHCLSLEIVSRALPEIVFVCVILDNAWPWLLGFDVSVEIRPACFSLSDRHIEYVTPSNGCLGASRCARVALLLLSWVVGCGCLHLLLVPRVPRVLASIASLRPSGACEPDFWPQTIGKLSGGTTHQPQSIGKLSAHGVKLSGRKPS